MKILVTGGLGFIGTEFSLLMSRTTDHELLLLDNMNPQVHGVAPMLNEKLTTARGVKVVKGDVRDAHALAAVMPGVGAIIHLAAETGTAQSMYQVARYNDVNSQGTAVLMDWLANNPHSVTKVVLASSRSIYGEGSYECDVHGNVVPAARSANQLERRKWNPVCPVCDREIRVIATPETSPPAPASIYAATKYAQEDLVRIAGCAHGFGTVVLRLQNVYGPGQSLNNPYTGLLSIFSTRIRRRLPLPIFEDGLESRDFVHVDDVARAFQLAVENESAAGSTLNVGSGRPTSVLDVANMLIEALSGHVRTEITGEFRLGDIRHCYADLGLVEKKLEFFPKVSLASGLESFASWVMSQPLPQDRLEEANAELRTRRLMS